MYNLTDLSTIKKLMCEADASFSHSLGQNFLIDPFVCPEMAKECGADKESGVLEIGPGIGVLTSELAKAAKKVVALEIDTSLLPVLDKTLSDFDNVKIIQADVMKTDLKRLLLDEFGDMPVYVCANLPYYITSPVIMRLLEEELRIKGITVMVQREAARRFCAEIGSRESGAVTVATEFYAERKICFDVPKESFYPSPKVDSSVMTLTPRDDEKYRPTDRKLFFAIVKAGFGKRRKTLMNALSSDLNISKDAIRNALARCSLDENIRIEAVGMRDLVKLSDALYAGR